MRYGYFDLVLEEFKKANIKVIEYKGIKPNPVIDDVKKASELAKNEKVDFIVALGGGSVIDSAKIISLGVTNDFDIWDIVTNKVKPVKPLPLIAILTLAATGTEMNAAAVVQNTKTEQKIGYYNPLIFPKESFLDPEYTFSVPQNHTAFGIVDLISHSLEAFFAFGDATLSDRFVGAIIQEAMYYAPLVLTEPKSYKYRAKIMWAATCALNGTTSHARKTSGDWAVHDIGHAISFLYDTPHGATLSIAYPAWLKFHENKIPKRIAQLGKILFNENNITTEKTIRKLEDFFKSMNCPIRLRELGFIDYDKNKILGLMIKNDTTGLHYKLTHEDLKEIVDFMY
jgi:alcohol dehydrogenase YqhD (iron-dependent ADH family)